MRLFILAGALLFSCNSFAQQENDAIKNTIAIFFDGLKKFDTQMIKTSLDTSCFLYSIMQKKDGSTMLVEEKTGDFFKQIMELKGNKADEQLLSYDIKTDGAMAIAWTPYKFYFNDTFSHCGVNVFTLIKRKGDWKIMGITDTRRKQDCE
jgi:hypothetical protein